MKSKKNLGETKNFPVHKNQKNEKNTATEPNQKKKKPAVRPFRKENKKPKKEKLTVEQEIIRMREERKKKEGEGSESRK